MDLFLYLLGYYLSPLTVGSVHINAKERRVRRGKEKERDHGTEGEAPNPRPSTQKTGSSHLPIEFYINIYVYIYIYYLLHNTSPSQRGVGMHHAMK